MSPKIFFVSMFISFLIFESVQLNEIINNAKINPNVLIKKIGKTGMDPSQSHITVVSKLVLLL